MAKGILNVGGGVVSVDASGNFTVDTGLIADGASVFNETGVDVDFRIESDDNANMFFVDGGNDRVGIGIATPASALDVRGTMQVGVNDTGYDVKFFGATSGAYAEWDESADELELRGGAATPGKLLLSTAETTVVDGNKLGQIDFQAPVDTAGTDAILVGASIWAEADATFSSSVNSTELVFATGASEVAAEKMRIASNGTIGIGTSDLEAWASGFTVMEILDIASIGKYTGAGDFAIMRNAYHDGAWKYKSTAVANRMILGVNGVTWEYAASGTADASLTWSESMRIDTSGNVGIGTTAPDDLLHVFKGDASAAPHSDAVMNIEHSDDAVLQILTPGNKYAALYFGDAAHTNDGGFKYDQNLGTMYIRTNDGDRMTIDASGKVGIGSTAPNNLLDVDGCGFSGSSIYLGDVGTSSFNVASTATVMPVHTLASSILAISWAGTNTSDVGVIGRAMLCLEKNFGTYVVNNLSSPATVHGSGTGNLTFSLSSTYLTAVSSGYDFVQIRMSWAVLTSVKQG